MDVIDEAAALGVQRVHLSGAGGEPLMKKRACYEMMKRIKHHGMQGSIVTNGMLFDDEMILSLVECGWDSIIFSIDGADAPTNDYLRQHTGAFGMSTQNAARFSDWKKRLEKDDPWMTLAPVLSSPNCAQLCDFIRLADRLGAQEVLYQPISIADHKLGGHLLLSDKEKGLIAEQLPEVARLSKERGIKTNQDYLDSLMIDKSNELQVILKAETQTGDAEPIMAIPCFSPWFHMGIRPDGNVSPCGVNPPDYAGNVLTDSLKDIWWGEGFSKFRKTLSSNQFLPFCRKCCAATIMGTRSVKKRLKEWR